MKEEATILVRRSAEKMTSGLTHFKRLRPSSAIMKLCETSRPKRFVELLRESREYVVEYERSASRG
jgi:hypothetical protein